MYFPDMNVEMQLPNSLGTSVKVGVHFNNRSRRKNFGLNQNAISTRSDHSIVFQRRFFVTTPETDNAEGELNRLQAYKEKVMSHKKTPSLLNPELSYCGI